MVSTSTNASASAFASAVPPRALSDLAHCIGPPSVPSTLGRGKSVAAAATAAAAATRVVLVQAALVRCALAPLLACAHSSRDAHAVRAALETLAPRAETIVGSGMGAGLRLAAALLDASTEACAGASEDAGAVNDTASGAAIGAGAAAAAADGAVPGTIAAEAAETSGASEAGASGASAPVPPPRTAAGSSAPPAGAGAAGLPSNAAAAGGLSAAEGADAAPSGAAASSNAAPAAVVAGSEPTTPLAPALVVSREWLETVRLRRSSAPHSVPHFEDLLSRHLRSAVAPERLVVPYLAGDNGRAPHPGRPRHPQAAAPPHRARA